MLKRTKTRLLHIFILGGFWWALNDYEINHSKYAIRHGHN